jgi:ribosomal protein S18 acetylase RimI-like enzyme
MKFEQKQSPEKFNIKKLTVEDADKYREIRLKGLETDPQSFGSTYEEEAIKDEEYWKERLLNPKRTFYVAEEGDKFISTATSNNYDENIWSIQAVYTLPEFRGKGLSETLIRKLIDEAGQKGAKLITLGVNQKNSNAISLYEKLGFKIVREKIKEAKDGDRDYFHMEKIL